MKANSVKYTETVPRFISGIAVKFEAVQRKRESSQLIARSACTPLHVISRERISAGGFPGVDVDVAIPSSPLTRVLSSPARVRNKAEGRASGNVSRAFVIRM